MNLLSMKRQAVPLYAEVAAVLRHQIMSGELLPGAKLPALSEFTGKLGVARMTIKQAMDALQEEGLIERHAGRGTFVRQVKLPKRHTLNMRAEISQLHAMVSQFEVSVVDGDRNYKISEVDGRVFCCMNRIHARDEKPFCRVDLRLDNGVFEMAPDRFAKEIVVTVLKDVGVSVARARQRVTIAYADFELAQALEIRVNSPVFRVFREFFNGEGKLIYSANLIYPGDLLEFEIEFAIDADA